jgi:ribosomal protein S18 acetylase RimI-like enzyme
MQAVQVRQAVLADLARVTPLFDHYRQFQGQASDLAACEQFLRARLDHGETVLFLACVGDQPLGLAQLYPIHSSVSLRRVFILNDLFVHAAGRRRGVAVALLDAVEAYAVSMGASSLRLNVTRDNVSAQALYEARQWQRDDHFFMYQRFPSA